MTDIDSLTQDLRSRINPAYADTIGTESYERKICADALEEQRNQIVLFATELERLRCLLHDSLYAGSKDWRESNLAGRIEWLITMYESAKDEIERLQAELAAAAFCDARCSWVEHHPSCVFSERDALRAELDALREAMRRLFQWAYTMAGYGLEHTGDHPLAVAKTMLEAAPKPGDSA